MRRATTAWRHGATLSAWAAAVVEASTERLSVASGWYEYRLSRFEVESAHCVPTADEENPLAIAVATNDGGLVVLSAIALCDPAAIARAATEVRAAGLAEPWSKGWWSWVSRAGLPLPDLVNRRVRVPVYPPQ